MGSAVFRPCCLTWGQTMMEVMKVNGYIKWVYISFSPLPFPSLFFFFFGKEAICKPSSDNHFAFLHFFFLGMVLITASCTVSQTSAKSLQLCPTLCNPIDGSPPGSAIPGILQARTLEWVAISFSSAWKWKVKVKLLSCVRLLATPWTAAYQAPPSMGFSRQEYWSGVPLPSPSRTSAHSYSGTVYEI